MINIAVEGESDRGAAEAIARAAGHSVGKLRVARGKSKLDPKVPKYAMAAQFENWVIFRDSDGVCPVELRGALAGVPDLSNPKFCLRIAHTMIESWLLADTKGFAQYFRVRQGRVPIAPDQLPHAKRALLDICGTSSSSALRREVLAKNGDTGPLYVSRINDFATTVWDVAEASERSPSLARAVARIGELR